MTENDDQRVRQYVSRAPAVVRCIPVAALHRAVREVCLGSGAKAMYAEIPVVAAEAWERGARAVTQTVGARMGATAPEVEARGF